MPSDASGSGTEQSEWVLILTCWPDDEGGFERPALERVVDRIEAEDLRHEYASNDGLHISDYTVTRLENVESLPFEVSLDDCDPPATGDDGLRADGPGLGVEDGYAHVLAHLCESCSESFDAGDEVVCLSDGRVNTDEDYEPENRRFWHRDCFPAPVGDGGDDR